jgi:hypothetical protein
VNHGSYRLLRSAYASERTREILDKNRNANIFRMMAHSPSYFEKYCLLGRAIRVKGELDPVVRELAITRTGILCEAPYEVAAHKRIGKRWGSPTSKTPHWRTGNPPRALMICSVRHSPSPTRSSSCTVRPTRLFDAIAAELTPAALIELQLSVGFYIMTSKFLETLASTCSRFETSCRLPRAHGARNGRDQACGIIRRNQNRNGSRNGVPFRSR